MSYRCIVGGTAGEIRTPISRFWRPVLCRLSFRRVEIGWRRRGFNPRPPVCKTGALAIALPPHVQSVKNWLRDVGSNHARSRLTAGRAHLECYRGFASMLGGAGQRALIWEAAAGFEPAMGIEPLALQASAFILSATPLLKIGLGGRNRCLLMTGSKPVAFPVGDTPSDNHSTAHACENLRCRMRYEMVRVAGFEPATF